MKRYYCFFVAVLSGCGQVDMDDINPVTMNTYDDSQEISSILECEGPTGSCVDDTDCFVDQCTKSRCVWVHPSNMYGHCVHAPYPDGDACFGYYTKDPPNSYIGTCVSCICLPVK